MRLLTNEASYEPIRFNLTTPLPGQLLERATLRGSERAWPIGDIPEVIEVAKENDLASVGGQLQLRFPDGGTCECGESRGSIFR